MSISPAAHPGQDPDTAEKGAWGGAWTVVYGCARLAAAGVGALWIESVARGARLGVAAIRASPPPEDAGDTARATVVLLERAPEALGAAQRTGVWAAGALGLVCVVAGIGVTRRSPGMRVAALTAVAASALLAAALTVHFAVVGLPALTAWARESAELLGDLRRLGARVDPSALEAVAAGGGRIVLLDSALLAVHLGLATALVVRLAGRKTRRWCDPGDSGGLARPGVHG